MAFVAAMRKLGIKRRQRGKTAWRGEESWDNENSIPRRRFSVDPVQRTKEICGRLEIPYVDSLQALREARSAGGGALRTASDYVHLDPEGHRAVGTALARRMLKDFLPL